MRSRFLVVLLLFFCLPAFGQQITIDVPVGGKLPSLEPLHALFLAEPTLAELTYTCDSSLEPAEFFYLCDLKPGDIITADRCAQAIANLARKRKFKRMHIATQHERDGSVYMHISLESYWTFDRLHVRGISRHKDRLAHLYEQEPGMPYNKQKHKESLKKMVNELQEQGYLGAAIADELKMDEKDKKIDVSLKIDRGRHYKIKQVGITIIDQAGVNVSADEAFIGVVDHLLGLVGKKYSGLLITDATKQTKLLLEQMGYLHPGIHLDRQLNNHEYEVALQFNLQLAAHHQFIFSGNSFFPNERLLKLLNAFGSMHEPPPPLLSAELERLYRAHGFSVAHVEIKERDTHSFVEIHEGERAVINELNIQTLDSASTTSIKADIFPAKSYYETELVQRGIDAISAQLRAQGFWDVAKIDQQFDGQTGKLNLTFDEGPRYYLHSIAVEKFPELVQEQIFSAAPVGEPFDYGLIQKQRAWLTNYLHRNGYMYAEAKPAVTMRGQDSVADDRSKRFVDIVWKIGGVNEPVHFGKTVVPGTCPIPFKDLKHQLAFEEGDTWSKEKMEQSVSRLRDLQIFSHIHLYPEDIAVPAASKTIMLNLVPDDPFEFRLRAGALGISKNFIWTQGVTYKVGATFLYKNVGHRGGILGADADVTGFEQRVSGYYRHPWLWGKRVASLTKGYSNKYIQPVMIGKRLPLYIVTQQGGLLGLSYKHRLEIPWIFPGEHALITVGANVGFEWVKTTLPDFKGDEAARLQHARAALAINFSPALDGVKVPYFYVEPTVVIDRMDDKLNPTRGTFTVASIKCVASLRPGNNNNLLNVDHAVEEIVDGAREDLLVEPNKEVARLNNHGEPGASSFVKFLIEHSWYVPAGSAVFAFRIRGGHVFNQRFSQIMPPERFYLGGPQTVRGYQPDFVPPLGRYEENCKCIYVPQGGRSMVNLNAEIRFPLFQKFSGAIFQDAGALFADEFTASIRERFVTASGFGIRYNTPIGPIRFDLGIKWRAPHEHEHRIAWYLALGHAF